MRPDDLCQLPDDCVEAILHECPLLAKPENQDDYLPVINDFAPNDGLQQAVQKKAFPDHNLVFATKNNETIQNAHNR